MADANQFTVPFKELAEVLVKHLDVHEGYWSVILKFGIHGATMSINNAPHLPSAIVPILEIGINREDQLGPLGVDAALINPAVRQRSGAVRATKRVARKK
jgi:hypothetical protein